MIRAESVDHLIRALPLALVGVDARGSIVGANAEAESLLGYGHGELSGQSVEILVPAAARARHAGYRETYLEAPSDRRMAASRDLEALKRDGTRLSVRISLTQVQTPRGAVTLAAIVDMSAQKALEVSLREQYEVMERTVAERTADLEQRNRDMGRLLEALEKARAELEQLSRLDPLTGLSNRREFDTRAQGEFRRAARRGSTTCAAMLDIDHFKAVNDLHGHRVGDDVLRRVARVLASHCRADDLIARYGGEEFVVLLPETELPDASAVVERMRRAVEQENWTAMCPGLALTISAGVAARPPGGSVQDLIDAADRNLYAAKASGRNRVQASASDEIPC